MQMVNMLKHFEKGNLVVPARDGKEEVIDLTGWGKVSKWNTTNEVNLVPSKTKNDR